MPPSPRPPMPAHPLSFSLARMRVRRCVCKAWTWAVPTVVVPSTGKGTHMAVYNGGGWDITLKVLDPISPDTFGPDADALAGFCPSYLCSHPAVPRTLLSLQAMHTIVPVEHASTKTPRQLALHIERESMRDLSRVHTQRGCEMEWQQSSEPFRTPRRKSVNRVCPCRCSGLGAEPTSLVPTQKPEARLRPKTLSQGRHDLGSRQGAIGIGDRHTL